MAGTGLTGRKETPKKGFPGAPPPPPPRVKGGGAAAVLDLSELTKGLEQGGSTYENEYGEEMMPAIQEELVQTYKVNAQFWLPKTEQTVINEMVSRARKIQRQIDGLED